jgi:uncharacterized protein YoxC
VSGLSEIFLGVIAAATLIMALIQIGGIVVAARLGREARETLSTAQETLASARQTMTSVQEEIRPLIAKASAVAEDASRTSALASAQMQKVDRLVTDVARRIDETSAVVQHAIVTPAREGLAVVAGVKAGLSALRGLGEMRRRPVRSEEEETLFIG